MVRQFMESIDGRVSNDPEDVDGADILLGVDISAGCGGSDGGMRVATAIVAELLRSGAINGAFACVVTSEPPVPGTPMDRVCAMAEDAAIQVCRNPVIIAIHSVDRRTFKSSDDEAADAAFSSSTESTVAE